MPSVSLILPMFAMVTLTLLVAILTVYLRVNAVLQKKLSAKYYRTFSTGESAPEAVLKVGRHFENLFETPTLYYIACTIGIIYLIASPFFMYLAWLYVSLRAVHAIIHITYNDVIHRLVVFGLSLLVLYLMWVYLVIETLKMADIL